MYIGQKRTNKTTEKEMVNDGYYGSGTLLIKDIKKYGRKNFKKEIIQVVDNQIDADKIEIEYIKRYRATESDEWYNIASGGQYNRTDDHSEMMSRIMKEVTSRPEYRKKQGWDIKKQDKRAGVMFKDSPNHVIHLINKLKWIMNNKQKVERLQIALEYGYESYNKYVRYELGKGGRKKNQLNKHYGKYSNEELKALVTDKFSSTLEASKVLGCHKSTLLNQMRGYTTQSKRRVIQAVKDSYYDTLSTHSI